MPWISGRQTLAALAPDPEWRGRPASTVPDDEWWSVNTPSGAQWADGGIEIRIAWVTAAGLPFFIDVDTITIETAYQDVLNLPGVEQPLARISMGPASNTTPWIAERILMPPRGLVSVRCTGMTAVGADRAVVQYWKAP